MESKSQNHPGRTAQNTFDTFDTFRAAAALGRKKRLLPALSFCVPVLCVLALSRPAMLRGALLFLSLFCILALAFAPLAAIGAMGRSDGQRSSPYSSERQEVSGLPRFDKIRANIGDISSHYGAEPRVFIENAHHLDTLSVTEDGTLLIQDTRSLKARVSRVSGIGIFLGGAQKSRDQVTVHLPVLTKIRASGTADIYAGAGFSGEKIDISVSGTASLQLEQAEFASMWLDMAGASDFRADASRFAYLDLDISGTGDAMVSNLVPRARLRVSSSGSADFTLQSEGKGSIGAARVDASGASDVTLLGFADSAPLSVDISGSSDLRYSGAPSVVQLDISGGADLTILD